MFGRKKNTKEKTRLSEMVVNIIGAGTCIQGDIVSEGDIRIDGRVHGSVKTTAKIVVGAEGEVNGDLTCHSADIMGKVTGIITVEELLHLRGHAFLKGDVYAPKFEMEATVKFNGRCFMEDAVVAPTATRFTNEQKNDIPLLPQEETA